MRRIGSRSLVEFLQQGRDHFVLEELGYALSVLDVRLRGTLVIRTRDRRNSRRNNEACNCDSKVSLTCIFVLLISLAIASAIILKMPPSSATVTAY
jgi:hypothetical protein